MATQLKKMKGEELITRILAGERDFSKIKLEDGFDLSGHKLFPELLGYLEEQYSPEEPLILDNSVLKGIKAIGLYAPNLIGWEVDLGGAVLREAYLEGVYFRRADLRGADLGDACLRGAHLRGSDFREANLKLADLERSDLRDVNFRKADLEAALLNDAKLSGADLRETKLSEAGLAGADLEGANLEGSNLFWGDLVRANLRRANLEGAILVRTYLNGADFEEANLGDADLRNAWDLEYAKIGGAYFRKTVVSAEGKEIIERAGGGFIVK